MNNHRRIPTQHELDLSQKLLEIRKKRKSTYLEDKLPNLAYEWDIRQNSAGAFISNYLENPSAWINNHPQKSLKGRDENFGELMCTRMSDYMEVLGYQPAEISDFFTLAGRVNKNYKAPERKERDLYGSLESYEDLLEPSTRKWVLSKFKGELGER